MEELFYDFETRIDSTR